MLHKRACGKNHSKLNIALAKTAYRSSAFNGNGKLLCHFSDKFHRVSSRQVGVIATYKAHTNLNRIGVGKDIHNIFFNHNFGLPCKGLYFYSYILTYKNQKCKRFYAIDKEFFMLYNIEEFTKGDKYDS